MYLYVRSSVGQCWIYHCYIYMVLLLCPGCFVRAVGGGGGDFVGGGSSFVWEFFPGVYCTGKNSTVVKGVLSTGAFVLREFCPRGYWPGWFVRGVCPRGFIRGFCPGGFVLEGLVRVVLSGGALSGGFVWGSNPGDSVRGVLSGGLCPKGFVCGGGFPDGSVRDFVLQWFCPWGFVLG